MTKEFAVKEAQRRANALGCEHVVFISTKNADANGWMVSSKGLAPQHHVIIDSYHRPNVKVRRGCLHTAIHTEGSLGWFCNTCGAPIDNLEGYCDG
jgi:hypothetical protein